MLTCLTPNQKTCVGFVHFLPKTLVIDTQNAKMSKSASITHYVEVGEHGGRGKLWPYLWRIRFPHLSPEYKLIFNHSGFLFIIN